MNQPSVDKFIDSVAEGGVVVYDSSLITEEIKRKDVTIVAIPATKLANEMGASKLANMILTGAMIKATGLADIDTVEKALSKVIPAKKADMLALNLHCIKKGME